jgi:hypothetical protein
MQNKVVLRYLDGRIQKGTTEDFSPVKETFHVKDSESGVSEAVTFAALKAVFFVKTFAGNAGYQERSDAERTGFGKKIRVTYRDGETQIGYTQGFAPNRPGFFIFPCDAECNNERIFVITRATQNVQFL